MTASLRRLALGALIFASACHPHETTSGPAVARWVYTVRREPNAPASDSPAEEMSKAAHALEVRAALIGIEGARVIASADEVTVDLPALDDATAARLAALFDKRGVLEFIPVADDMAKAKTLADAMTAAVADTEDEEEAAAVRLETDVWFTPGTHHENRIPHLASDSRAALLALLAKIDANALLAPLSIGIGEAAPAHGGGMPHWRTWILDRRAGLLDPRVVRAESQTSRTAMQPQISVEFTEETAKRFADLTRKHVGQKLAIVIDGEVESAPIIQEAVVNGHATVSMGRDTPKDATDLAVVLGSGRLPYDIERTAVVDKRTGRKTPSPKPSPGT